MHGWRLAVLALGWMAGAAVVSARAYAQENPPASDDLPRARALDQQGVRAFRDGRYNDAIRYFDEALKLGGPATELWNIARCHLKLDDPEAAADAFERFLAHKDLLPQDRAEARQQLEELKRRRSTVTIASSPTGAYVAVDGKRIGRTPTSIEVAAGAHTLALQREGFAPYIESVEAHFGRAVIVDARLAPGGDGTDTASGAGTKADEGVRRFTASALIGVFVPRMGTVGLAAHPAALVSVGYVLHDAERLVASVGLRGTFTYDTWSNTVGAPALSCNLTNDESATAVSAFLDAALGYRASARFRFTGDFGFGLAVYPASQRGADLFEPSCDASTSVRPAVHFGADASYAFTPALRALLAPILLEVQPAFDGARTSPIDASGAWLRIGAGLGIALDL
jgi:hypothetical protein